MKTFLKKSSLFALALMVSASAWGQNGRLSIKGRTTSTDGSAVGYATVVLLDNADSTHTYGAASDEQGRFEVKAPKGDYLLRASFLGYKSHTQQIKLTQSAEIGDLKLEPSSTNIEEVVVKAEAIVREADRFVVNVANTPQAIGQTAKEMLAISPGVWVDEKNGISINGKANPQVYINDRLVRETGEDLVTYLTTIKAEDIQKIEVIPTSGVEFDADSQGGVIKITLKKQRENGIEGSVTMRYGHSIAGENTQYIQPSVDFNYMHNKVRFYTTLSENNYLGNNRSTYTTQYDNGDQVNIREKRKQTNDWPSIRVGGIYDINKKHSVGLEANVRGFFPGKGDVSAKTDQTFSGNESFIDNNSENYWKRKTMNLSANYIAKIDTVGSTFKLVADYYYQNGWDGSDFNSLYSGFIVKDSIYSSRSNSRNNLYALTGDFDIKVGKMSRISAGAKYSRRDVEATSAWTYEDENKQWHEIPDPNLNFTNSYAENIAALYGSYSVTFKNKWSLKAGLRGEYTYATPEHSEAENIPKQNYFSLFPNANLSMPLNEKMSHMLIVNYARKINRPWYGNLIPVRQAINDNMVFVGNPDLAPAYANDASISYVFKQKYNLTIGMQYVTDAMGQVGDPDPNDPSVFVLTMKNMENTSNYYANLNVPVEVTKWWKINANLMGGRQEVLYNSGIESEKIVQYSYMGNMSNTFTLYKNLYYMVDFRGNGPMIFGTLKALPSYRLDTGIKYTFGKNNKYTTTLYVNDLLNTGSKQRIILTSTGSRMDAHMQWDYRRIGASFRYNFKSGKTFRVKTVETGERGEGGSGGGGGFGGGGGGN